MRYDCLETLPSCCSLLILGTKVCGLLSVNDGCNRIGKSKKLRPELNGTSTGSLTIRKDLPLLQQPNVIGYEERRKEALLKKTPKHVPQGSESQGTWEHPV